MGRVTEGSEGDNNTCQKAENRTNGVVPFRKKSEGKKDKMGDHLRKD